MILTNPGPFFPKCVPEELQLHDQWVNWVYESRTPGAKPTKVPKRPSGAFASHSNPDTWSTWEQVLKGYDTGRFSGVGFVFSEEDAYAGVDFDHVRDATTGEIDAWVREWLQRLDSYTEVSPSLTGLKVWVRAELPPGKHKKTGERQLELYDKRRFFTTTGQALSQFPATIKDRQSEVEALFAAELPRKVHTHKPRRSRYIGGTRLDLSRFLYESGAVVFGEIADNAAQVAYSVRCPWWRQHTGEDVTGTRALQYPSGATYFICEHAHCEGRTWRDFYRAIRRPVRASNFLEVNISYGR